MKRIPALAILVGALGALGIPGATADAANSPTFRDCSLIAGLDPDFVVLTGASADSQGNLTVTQGQNQVTLMASESAVPGDQSGHDTFTATVSAPGVAPQTVSGRGVGQVALSVPLSGAEVGSAYTITWAATFDDGSHACPSALTPQNTTSDPFVLNVLAASTTPTPGAPTVANLQQSHPVWRERVPAPKTTGKAKLPVGTSFAFTLDEPARVELVFTQRVKGRMISRGTLSIAGRAGINHVAFQGRLRGRKPLTPGRYTLAVTAESGGLLSPPRSISFTIAR